MYLVFGGSPAGNTSICPVIEARGDKALPDSAVVLSCDCAGRLAGSVAVEDLMAAMRTTRSVFHSEVHLQHHLARQAHLLDPQLQVRLEFRPDTRIRESVDVMLVRPDLGMATFIELKYLKAAWSGLASSEQFDLPNTGAHDIVRYDVIKDIERLERFVDGRPNSNGLMLCLTNDSLHWREPTGMRATIAEAFRIHEGSRIHGIRQWDGRAGAGTTRGRTAPLHLRGQYGLQRPPYSRIDNGRTGEFRLLAVSVEPGNG